MGNTQFEQRLIRELKQVTNNRKLTGKCLMEWCTSEIKPHEGEKVLKLPSGIWVAYKE
jgi:hypothetical protein